MISVTVQRLIYLDQGYCLPHDHKVDLGIELVDAEVQEREKYATEHFNMEYNTFLDYLLNRYASVLCSGTPIFDFGRRTPEDKELDSGYQAGEVKSWNAVYELSDAILSCYFDRGESPKIAIKVLSSPESIDDKVKEIERLFEGKPMRTDHNHI